MIPKLSQNKLYESGLSLIEILITISIIALISVIAIPNLRNFAKTQDINNVSKDIINTLRTARSNTLTNTKCPNGVSSDYWKVKIEDDKYQLIARCSGTEIIVKTYNLTSRDNVGSGVNIVASSVCLDLTLDINIVYTTNDYYFYCSLGAWKGPDLRTNLTIELKDEGDEENKADIVINQAGVINDI